MEKKATIAQVSALAEVSKSTVSNYLNGRFTSMSADTKEKIEQAIKKLDYTPSLSARRLSAKEKCKAICMIIPHNIARAFDISYFPTVISACGQTAEKVDYNVIVYAMNRKNADKNINYLKGMASTVVDGFLIFDLSQNDRFFKEFEKSGIPYVCIGKINDFDDYHYVASDHGQVVKEAIIHLLRLGHRRIAQIMEDASGVVERVRLASYREVHKRYGIPVNENYLCNMNPYELDFEQRAYEQFRHLLLQPQRPTALICPAMFVPIVQRIVHENQRSIPEDLSVIIMEYDAKFHSNLENYTRIQTIAAQITEHAFKKLLKSIYSPNRAFESQLYPLSLTIGDSTMSPKKSGDEEGFLTSP